MSLNGLDAPATQEAYQYAVAESGGWLLLKYVNRDSVELYDRGKGGVNEARVAVSKYEEQSPLYGLIVYRRRKVLIKYVPEGTSRLLQARTSVHFQDVMEKYAPYETLLEFTAPDGLSDTALAAVFPLHTASPAISSNRLNEITEDGEEGAPETAGSTRKPPPSLKSHRERRAERVARSDRQRKPQGLSSSPPPSIRVNGETSPTDPLLASPKSTISQFLVRDESGHRSVSSLTAPSVASVTEYAGSDRSDTNTEPESAPPSKIDLVSPSSTPSASPLPSPVTPAVQPTEKPLPQEPPTVNESSFQEQAAPALTQEGRTFVPETRKPTGLQEKEGQSQEQDSSVRSLRARNDAAGRPSADKPREDDPYDLKKYDYLFKPKPKLGPRLVPQDTKKTRPSMPTVAAVPLNVKPQPPKKDSPVRPKSQGPAALPAAQVQNLPAPPPIPDTPEYSPRPLSRGSVKSLPSHKSTAMTPDKLRLMKAIELRKKQMRKSQGAEMTGAPKFDASAPEVPKIPEQQQTMDASQKMEQVKGAPLQPEESPSKKADSGIEMDYHDAEKREDKPTLELLVSPRNQVGVRHESEKAERPDSPTPVTESSPELTPKAEAVAPVATSNLAQDNDNVREADQSNSKEHGAICSSPKHARVPTLVEPISLEAGEPSLDERQVFGDQPKWQYAGEGGQLEAPQKSARRQNSDLAKRRRGYIEPLHLEDMSSDDEFVEELRTATVQQAQARPMKATKSPVTEAFIRRPSYATSFTSEASDAQTENARYRSASVATKQSDVSDAHVTESVETSPSAERPSLKRNVSSGISRRIQALSDNSSRDPSPNGYNGRSHPFGPESASGNLLLGERPGQSRGSLRPPRSRTSSFQKTARLSARISASQQSQLAGSMQHPENTPVLNVHRDPTTNRDSVSVTARIVRPPMNDKIPINDDRPTPVDAMAQLTRLDTSSPPIAYQPESAASMSPDQLMRTMHSSTRNQFGRHRQATPTPGTPLSPHPDDFPAPPAPAGPRTQSSASLASANDETAALKEGTRTSRFFKRMSNIATKRRSTAQGSVAGDSINSNSDQATARSKGGATASRDGERSADMPPAVTVGNLNVQFPDSLLWKRRIVSVDDHGNLCFVIPQAMEHQRSSAKKFPLNELRMPYIPDLDRQELPFSVMLDFADGTTLQAACEDTMTHRQVVHVLKSYWKAWQGQ